MKKFRVFISQPMSGLTDEEIKRVRGEAIKTIYNRFGEDDVEIIESFFEGAPHDAKPLWYLSKSLELLSTADMLYLCKGWEKSRGCCIEYECAVAYGNINIYGDDWDLLVTTIPGMKSASYKERFDAEYRQLLIRYTKLKAMCDKWDNGKLDFTPTCPRDIYDDQLKAMRKYLYVLTYRAKLEKVNLDYVQ